MTSTTNRRKILIPLATLLAAGAVAVGSGATFTSTSVSSSAVTAGTLKHSNTADAATLNISKIKPGDTVTGSLTIKNTGDLDSTLTLQETDGANTFKSGDLLLSIVQDGNTTTPVYTGNFGGLDDTLKKSLGELPVGASTTLTFAVSMPTGADNTNQGKTAAASYQWVTTQKAGSSSTLSWG